MVPKATPISIQSYSISSNAETKSFIISCFIISFTVIAFILSNERFSHWFILPVWLCGMIIGIDAVKWFRNKYDLFDPFGIMGVLGVHFFFLAPMLHVQWNLWMNEVAHPPDWRYWLGITALINLSGLLIYRFARNLVIPVKKQRTSTVWTLNEKVIFPVWITILSIAFAIQLFIYISAGGIANYIELSLHGSGEYTGYGIVFMFSESFPIVLFMGYIILRARHMNHRITWTTIFLILAGFLILQIFFGGLRGSRSNTIWSIFWAVGMIHFYLKPITKKVFMVGLCFIFVFMYLYGFFKADGLNGIKAYFEGKDSRQEISMKYGRTASGLLLGDLGRSDVQAYIIYRMIDHKNDFQHALGYTYVGTSAMLIPTFIMPDKPPTKVKAGTEALHGKDTYIPKTFESSKVYGLLGETLINFGIIGVPFAFALFGLFVGMIKRLFTRWQKGDLRILLLPLLINWTFVILTSDTDNNLFFIVKSGFVPFAFIYFISKKKKVIEHES